jgi:diguanylate cyclase (GGDEF)-like protein
MTRHIGGAEFAAQSEDTLTMISWSLTEDLDESKATPQTYRRLLGQALDLAGKARRELVEANRRIAHLEHESRTDPATGVLNRRGFEIELAAALSRAARKGERGLLVMIDLDGFKPVNDTHGHQAGDLILATVANLLERHTRDTDAVARLGGDEFAVLLNDADHDGARKRVSILDRLLNGTMVTWDGFKIPVRASFGVADFGPDDDAEGVARRADEAMYARKRAR